MSGNMSFLNNNSGTRSAIAQDTSSSTSRHGGGDQGQQNGRGSRISTSFRDASSILDSFVEEENESKWDLEALCDNDVWGNRIILSALADIVFSEMPHPKLAPDVIQGLQKFLLSVNVATSACNRFVEYEKSHNTTADLEIDDANTRSNNGNKNAVGIPKVDLPKELVEGLTPECKVVLKSLIGAYIRKQTEKIRMFWKPILEMDGVKVPELPQTSLFAATQRRSVAPAQADGGQLKQLFDLILNQAKGLKSGSQQVDAEVEELLKKRSEEMRKYERDINKFKDLTVDVLKELKAQETPEFRTKYMDYLNLETERVNQQIRLVKLKADEEERGTDQEQKERLELYNNVQAKLEDMISETEEMEETLQKYKSLGPQYTQLLEEYKTLDEEVKLKEWVVEQLANGPKDESLFSDSFTD